MQFYKSHYYFYSENFINFFQLEKKPKNFFLKKKLKKVELIEVALRLIETFRHPLFLYASSKRNINFIDALNAVTRRLTEADLGSSQSKQKK